MLIILLIILLFTALYFKFKNYVPVLMYHRIADVPGDRNSLPREKFEDQLRYLAESNYVSITPKELYAHYAEGAPLPKKCVLLTFDDGYADNYTEALPLLLKYNMTAVVFPIGNWIGRPNHWENFGKKETKTMTEKQLLSWLKSGMDVQPHTLNHPFLTGCTQEQLESELIGSKLLFERLLLSPMDYLCYPYGCFNAKTAAAAKKADYKMAFAIFENVPLWNLDLFALPRIPVPSHQKMWEFKLKVSSVHVIFIALRKWERSFKRLKNKLKDKLR